MRGIKTPEYSFFWGNYPELLKSRVHSDVYRKWTKEYGKIYGFYEGHLPVIVTTDLQFIEDVFIKQFSNFSARKKIFFMPNENSKFVNLFSATKARWKRLRNIMNPTFSTSKLRELNPHLIKCTDRLLKKLEENKETEINITNFLKRFTMDSIWNVAFGVDTDMQNDLKNPYFYKCEETFVQSGSFGILLFIATYFHEFRGYLMGLMMYFSQLISIFGGDEMVSAAWVRNRITDVVDVRLKDPNGQNKRDYLQLLLDARNRDSIINISEELQNSDLAKLHIEKAMNFNEMKMNLALFLFAGYETTSTVLSYVMYILANHADEQQKVFNEINDHFPQESKEEPNVDNIQKLTYLDMFIKEVMRMYPILNALGRECTNATNVCGIDIPEKSVIIVDVLTVSYDPEIWGEDANEFNPMRFSPEIKRNPVVHMAFGLGPKNCIGMKFALLEMKVAIVKILLRFELFKTQNTASSLEYSKGIVRSPKDGIRVLFKKRSLN